MTSGFGNVDAIILDYASESVKKSEQELTNNKQQQKKWRNGDKKSS